VLVAEDRPVTLAGHRRPRGAKERVISLVSQRTIAPRMHDAPWTWAIAATIERRKLCFVTTRGKIPPLLSFTP
jgi:hypothetical protein